MSASERPDVKAVLGGLKDFQRATVDHVFDRFYGADPTRRFLLADEVGLGKTLVAKGVIAKAIDHLWDKVDRIDIVYVCSNSDIARQNITRLHPERDGFTLASRITLLPLSIQDIQQRKVNFISFTPGTSLEAKSATGIARERALLLRLLDPVWGLKGQAPLKFFGEGAGRDSFARRYRTVCDQPMCEELAVAYRDAVERQPELRVRYDELAQRYRYVHRASNLPDEVRRARRELIGDLRHLLAQTCIKSLEPDLVILDEFQRFRHLLAGEEPAAELARELFDWQRHDSDEHARVLLMSATPYKMYTVNGEPEDDHYKDFIATLRFLIGNDAADQLADVLTEFRRELMRFTPGEEHRLLELHRIVEEALRKGIVRTERVGGGGADRDGMLSTASSRSGYLDPSDIADYLAMRAVAGLVGEPDPMEYWKSAPYLPNFLGDGYKLTRQLKAAVGSATGGPLAEALSAARMIEPADVASWADIDPGNARMRGLLHDTVGRGMWKLLWIPPAHPHYKLEEPYASGAEPVSLTKRLVFSSWAVVPRAVASIVSYTAEREMWQAGEPDALNTTEVHDARRGRLAFAVASGRPSNMPVAALLYPSAVLAELCDPLLFAAERPEQLGSLADLRDWARERVRSRIADLLPSARGGGAEDNDWYWALPLRLDAAEPSDDAAGWLSGDGRAEAWSGGTQDSGAYAEHVARAMAILDGSHSLGRVPDRLVDVVAELGLFGWGNSAYRALSRVATPEVTESDRRLHAAQIAWGLRTLFNLPEVYVLVPALFDGDAYWRQCLSYSAAGGLQSMLDEYVHLLVETLGYSSGTPDAIAKIAARVVDALSLRASRVVADEVQMSNGDVGFERMRLRARFAARFGDQEPDDGEDVTRADAVRTAFNSPFWPFVLASTSVGQEGLDFHHYCHAIVHWNLPTNPVDLEQREGRIHRYKNHAVRKNVAERFGEVGRSAASGDPWAEMFQAGSEARSEGETDLVPYWLFPEGSARIERHVPSLPLSREVEQFHNLQRSLAVYRMAFGQPRQEDLVAYLLGRLTESQVGELVERLRIDLRPRTTDDSA